MIPDDRETRQRIAQERTSAAIRETAAVINALAFGVITAPPAVRHKLRWLFARCPKCKSRIWAVPWKQASWYRAHYIMYHMIMELDI